MQQFTDLLTGILMGRKAKVYGFKISPQRIFPALETI